MNEYLISYDDDDYLAEFSMIGGGAASLLLDFDLRPTSHRRTWPNVLHKRTYNARLCLNIYLQSLAQKLTSNEQFFLNDSFTVETTFIQIPGPGSEICNKIKPGKKAVKEVLHLTRSLVPAKSTDQLYCA